MRLEEKMTRFFDDMAKSEGTKDSTLQSVLNCAGGSWGWKDVPIGDVLKLCVGQNRMGDLTRSNGRSICDEGEEYLKVRNYGACVLELSWADKTGDVLRMSMVPLSEAKDSFVKGNEFKTLSLCEVYASQWNHELSLSSDYRQVFDPREMPEEGDYLRVQLPSVKIGKHFWAQSIRVVLSREQFMRLGFLFNLVFGDSVAVAGQENPFAYGKKADAVLSMVADRRHDDDRCKNELYLYDLNSYMLGVGASSLAIAKGFMDEEQIPYMMVVGTGVRTNGRVGTMQFGLRQKENDTYGLNFLVALDEDLIIPSGEICQLATESRGMEWHSPYEGKESGRHKLKHSHYVTLVVPLEGTIEEEDETLRIELSYPEFRAVTRGIECAFYGK